MGLFWWTRDISDGLRTPRILLGFLGGEKAATWVCATPKCHQGHGDFYLVFLGVICSFVLFSGPSPTAHCLPLALSSGISPGRLRSSNRVLGIEPERLRARQGLSPLLSLRSLPSTLRAVCGAPKAVRLWGAL